MPKIEKMKKYLYIILLAFVGMIVCEQTLAKPKKRRAKAKTHVVAKKKTKKKSKKTRVVVPKKEENDDANPYIQCEDTCEHVHGIDLSHYQGEVFWETVGENTKMAYVYLKATEGGDRIDPKYERNIDLAHRYGLKVGSYHFFRPRTPLYQQLENFKAQCRPGEQDLIPMIDIETTGGLPTDMFCDQLLRFLQMVEATYRQKPLLYTYRNFYNKHLVGKVDDYKLMIAMYLDEEPVLEDGRDITMWQYTSKGRIMGVSGFVDKSRFMGNHGLRDIRFHHYHD
jgi:lysozyme